jgi:hypothetical protein
MFRLKSGISLLTHTRIQLQINLKKKFKTKANVSRDSKLENLSNQNDIFRGLLKKSVFTVLVFLNILKFVDFFSFYKNFPIEFGGACFSTCAILSYENRKSAFKVFSSQKYSEYRSQV